MYVQQIISESRDEAYLVRLHGTGRGLSAYTGIQELYTHRKETIERVFYADAKEMHGMRYTPYRGLALVTKWVRL